ncbi:FabD/lysophospholipase-like protein, partial [Sistotremastrum suecicum HHB10207 ss-3]
VDGGGIRGLSELLILKEIMYRIKVDEGLVDLPRPCEYFDLIGGTSTGGLIALMLGRLGMTIDEAVACYAQFAEEVFSTTTLVGEAKFSSRTLENIFKKIVKEKTEDEDERMISAGNRGVKTFVCTMAADNMNAAIPRLFRNYEVPKHATSNCKIWEAARATSAAPTFFDPIFIGEGRVGERYIDGGMGRNNPITQVREEAKLIFPERRIGCLVSIGAGKGETISIPRTSLVQKVPGLQRHLPLKTIEAMKKMATDSERTAEETERDFQGQPEVYFRLNVEQGMQKVGLSQWERLSEVTSHTEAYLRHAGPDQRLGAIVAALRHRGQVVYHQPDLK